MPEIRLRPETPEDAQFVDGLFAAMKADEFAPLGLPAEALTPLVAMQVRIYRTGLRNDFPQADCHVIELDSRRVGFVALAHDDGGWLLAQFLVAAPERGRGIGTAVLECLLAEARALSLSLRLCVSPLNPAIRLYQRMGFTECGHKGTHIAMVTARDQGHVPGSGIRGTAATASP